MHPFSIEGYLHDSNKNKGESEVLFQTELPEGQYEVQIAYPPNSNRASNVPVTIRHAGGTKVVQVNQREKPTINGVFRGLGKFRFDATTPAQITIGNRETDGYVVVDAVRFLPTE